MKNLIRRIKKLWKLSEPEAENNEPTHILHNLKGKTENTPIRDFKYKFEGKPQAQIIKRKPLTVEEEVAEILNEN